MVDLFSRTNFGPLKMTGEGPHFCVPHPRAHCTQHPLQAFPPSLLTEQQDPGGNSAWQDAAKDPTHPSVFSGR